MKRILVIDDEPSVARLIGQVLKLADVEHSLDYCSDGAQGRARAAQGKYDVITLDLAMPLMDGVEALEEMRRNPKSADTPVVVVTAKQDSALHERVMALGATAVVTKPFELWELGDIFRLILARKQAKPPAGAGPDRRETASQA